MWVVSFHGLQPWTKFRGRKKKASHTASHVPASRGWMQCDQVPQAWVGSIRVLPLAEKRDFPTMMGYTLNLKLEPLLPYVFVIAVVSYLFGHSNEKSHEGSMLF